MAISQEQIEKNANAVVKLIEKYVINEERKVSILKMLEDIGTLYYTAPAARSKHSAHPGGLVNHSIVVTKILFRISEQLAPDIEKESLLIIGLFHDLGKACTIEKQDVYVPNPSEWHRDKLGRMYEHNSEIRDGLTHAQRSVRLLGKYGVQLTDQEYLAILSHDGMYVDENICFKNKMGKLAWLLHSADSWTAFFEEI